VTRGILGVVALAGMSGGCGTVQNVIPNGASTSPPALVYGGFRSDLTEFCIMPDGGFPLILPLLMADAVGDTLTLPIVIAIQSCEYLKSKLLQATQP